VAVEEQSPLLAALDRLAVKAGEKRALDEFMAELSASKKIASNTVRIGYEDW